MRFHVSAVISITTGPQAECASDFIYKVLRDFPGSAALDSALPVQEAQVPSPVGELSFHMSRSQNEVSWLGSAEGGGIEIFITPVYGKFNSVHSAQFGGLFFDRCLFQLGVGATASGPRTRPPQGCRSPVSVAVMDPGGARPLSQSTLRSEPPCVKAEVLRVFP